MKTSARIVLVKQSLPEELESLSTEGASDLQRGPRL